MMTIGMPSWSLIPGTTEDLSTSVGFQVKNKSSMLFILVGSRRPLPTTCSSPKSFAISINCFDKPGATPSGLVFRRSQSMSGRLK